MLTIGAMRVLIQQARAEATALKSNVAALEAAKATLEGPCFEFAYAAVPSTGDPSVWG